MAAATAVIIPARATAPLLHHRHSLHNYGHVLATARSSSCGSVHRRRRPILSPCRGHGRAASPLVPASDHWGNWTFLLSAAAVGTWSEKRAPMGKVLAGAVVSVLLGLAASTTGVVAAADAPAYRVVLDYLLPLAIPLVLFRADLRRVLRPSGAMLLAFLLGSGTRLCPPSWLLPPASRRIAIASLIKIFWCRGCFDAFAVATMVGTVVALLLVPMRSLGSDGWKIAVAMMSRHIGGGLSYVAVCQHLGVSPSALAAGLAAGNTICALYLAGLFAFAANIPAEELQSPGEEGSEPSASNDNVIPATQTAMAVAAAFAICRAGMLAKSMLEQQLGIPGPGISLLCTTATMVLALATFFPSQIRKLAPPDDALAVLFAVMGANGSMGNAINTAPCVFALAFVQIAIHLLVTLGLGKMLGFDRKLLLVASAANVGGLTTACGMATAKGWTSMVAPVILAGIFGMAITTAITGFILIVHLVDNFMTNPITIVMGMGFGLGKLVLNLKIFFGIGFSALAFKYWK
ncbi:hypothetical protein HU200_059321 [Digitaria exilis]|uniref:Uncharacterized protein n=1 Tax=Digitaria exilis TaxID=1010633 RepID=A0A835A8W2_9POAL|nr:hypothetical protein HU200_059321 [Digitaria exilis]